MFDFLKSFFGDSDAQSGNTPSKAEKALQALDIDVAIASHENWKIRLQAHLNGTSTETLHAETICFDDQCDLGKWIYLLFYITALGISVLPTYAIAPERARWFWGRTCGDRRARNIASEPDI